MKAWFSLVAMLSVSAWAAPPLPKELVLPVAVTLDATRSPWVEYDDAVVVAKADGSVRTVAGQVWTAQLALGGLPATTDEAGWLANNAVALSRMKAAFKASGFEALTEDERGGSYHFTRAGHEYWASLNVLAADDMRLRVVMPTAGPAPLKLMPPAARPEAVPGPEADFPFLTRLPGAGTPQTQEPGTLFAVALPGHPEEALVVSQNPTLKTYTRPSLGNAHLLAVYHPALVAAGWAVTTEYTDLNAVLEAHFTKNGRDLWLRLRHTGEDAYEVLVADLGAQDFGRALRADCRVSLDGVLFDFNQATLQPSSDVVLQRVLLAVQQNPGLALEVQGHTDGVGGDDFNQKLSEARAKAVLSWLVAKGAKAGQLTARGYGKTRPLESNESPAGRARNRRVELACRR
jgi:outer membrane protein OmpA-like peptidoglycan-associated protein